jgi:SAM-dependent methyltransferase
MEANDTALRAYYERGMERERLSDGRGDLEFTRTTEIVARRLPAAPAVIADIGGGPGRYALWLASLGYQVEHRDLMPLHVEQLTADAAGVPGIRTAVGDARDLDLPDASVDAVWSRTALEHIQPIDRALDEVARVLRPGGVAHHVIDPFFWLKGCHARGLTDLPWAHARLELDDYERFVHKAESRRRAARRTDWLRTLNRLTASDWRRRFEHDERFELLACEERVSPVAEEFLAQHPEVLETMLPGLSERDLTCCAVEVLVRRRSNVQAGAQPV